MENARYTINQKITLAALQELNEIFCDWPTYGANKECTEALMGGSMMIREDDGSTRFPDYFPEYGEAMQGYLKDTLMKYPSIVDVVSKAFDEAFETDNVAFFDGVNYQLTHHWRNGTLAVAGIIHDTYFEDKEPRQEDLKAASNSGWVPNGSNEHESKVKSRLLNGLMQFGFYYDIDELADMYNVIRAAFELRGNMRKAMAACPQTNAVTPKSDEQTTARLGNDEAENKLKKANRPIPVITDEMVSDFAGRFGTDKGDYREILEDIAQLSSSKIGHYLYKCKTKFERLNADLIAKNLHQWLWDEGFNVKKYMTWIHTFK